MVDFTKFYIDGKWVDPVDPKPLEVINPATEKAFATISLGNSEDVNRAVIAATKAFSSFSKTTRKERLELFDSIIAKYTERMGEVVEAITQEMGAPVALSQAAQAPIFLAHMMTARSLLETYSFAEDRGTTRIVKEPIGVCGFIVPWNWPINQIVCKLAPALAVGCTVVMKPTEVAPISAMIMTDILEEAGLPPGVLNLVNGDGQTVGQAICAHEGVDMVSFTGSARGGIAVAKTAADTVKRVAQELGGKSANIILDDADLQTAVAGGVVGAMTNSGQSCNAPTRMLVPTDKMEEVAAIAKATVDQINVGDPTDETTTMGPVVNETQWNKIQDLIQKGIDEGATLITGGLGRPEGLDVGFYVKPTIFTNVSNDMTIAQEEIFGPVLSILPYKDDAQAIAIANDTPFGLSGYVSSGNLDRARRISEQIRTGMVHINGAEIDPAAPFGGYKQSGNGREWGIEGFAEFVETKAIMGYGGN